jgi:trehalose 6-phosphate synthase
MRGLTVVSNRLPVSFRPRAGGGIDLTPSDGGLVSALRPVLRERGGAWAGWTGSSGDIDEQGRAALRAFARREGYQMVPVTLSERARERYYEGACNRVLWPLLHGLADRAEPSAEDASIYHEVNRRFAEVVARTSPDVVWVHDYHLLSVGAELRRRLPRARLGFFLHIPFPASEQMARLSWGPELVPSLAAFDVVGFQTERDRRNYLDWARLLDARTSPRQQGFEARSGAFGISVDWRRYHDEARRPSVLARAEAIRRELRGRRILLGVDRLDYTKGIPHRLHAYAHLLATRPALHGRVTFVQLAVPSRGRIDAYERTRAEVEALVAAINARYGTADWEPIRYVYGTWSHDELLAWYVAADAAVVTPVRDGMNLVAKEFMAANHGRGVLVLSRFAGAAEDVGKGALLVNPGDTGEVAAALWTALDMPRPERELRVRRVQDHLRRHDVHRWADAFIAALTGSAA